VFGAPWVEPFELVNALRSYGLPGVAFRAHVFEPTFQKHAHQSCGGAQMIVMDRETFKPVLTGIAVLCALQSQDPESFTWRTERYEYITDRLAIDLLLGDPKIREAVEAGHAPRDISDMMLPHTESYIERSRAFWVYD